MYSLRGRAAPVAVAANDAVFGIWNPHSTQRIKLLHMMAVIQSAPGAANSACCFRRTTARGTPGSTVTPNISNDSRRGVAPVSGLLLDLADFTVEPTLEAEYFGPVFKPTGSSVGDCLSHDFLGGLVIPPGTGLAWISLTALAPGTQEISLTWTED